MFFEGIKWQTLNNASQIYDAATLNLARPFTNDAIDAAVQEALQKLEDDPRLADRTTLTPA